MYEIIVLIRQVLQLRKNEQRSRDHLQALQLRKFRILIAKLAKSSAYYKDYCQANRIDPSSCLPADFPIMEKSDILQNFDRIVTDQRLTLAGVTAFVERSDRPSELYHGYHIVHTSGTSGEIGYFVYSRRHWLKGMAQNVRSLPFRKLFAAKRYVYCGASTGHRMSTTAVLAGFRWRTRNRDILVIDANEPISSAVARINRHDPVAIGSYATALVRLAGERLAGRLTVKPLWVESFAEPISADDRSYIEDAFGCGLYNMYGATETQLMAMACPGERAMTLYDDEFIFEIHDGYLLVTSLLNETLPLIRYKINDSVRIADGKAKGPYRLIEELIGRKANIATFLNEHGRTTEIADTDFVIGLRGVARFQICPTSMTSLEFRLQLKENDVLASADVVAMATKWLKQLLAKYYLSNIDVNTVVVSQIAVDQSSRKFRLLDLSRLKTAA